MLSLQLKDIRKSKNISQVEMAKAINVTQGTIANWETGKRTPDLEMLKRIANYFDISLDELTGNKRESSNIRDVIPQDNIHMVPVYATVSAGFGAYADDSVIDYIPMIIENPYDAPDIIGIRVKGDSMYPKIEDGDTIIVRRQESVDSGSVAVLLLDGEEGLVKKVEYGRDWIELHSFNPEYKTRRFEGEDVLRLRVVGKVLKVVKSI